MRSDGSPSSGATDELLQSESYFRSGFDSHDKTAGAFQRGGFYLFAARPGVGKTAMLFSLAYRQARLGVTTYFVNLEMTVEQMWIRLAALHRKDLTVRELLEGEMDENKIAMLKDLHPFHPCSVKTLTFWISPERLRETSNREVSPYYLSITWVYSPCGV